MTKTNSQACSSCRSSNVKQVVLIEKAPAHCNVLWDDRSAAIDCPKGDIQLNFCNDCGHLYNQVFDHALMSYDQEYENTLDFSPVFQKYSKELVERLTKTYDLQDKDIIEIGCGKGDFLKMICADGKNRGYGFDKSYDPSLEENKNLKSIEFIEDFYSEKYSKYPSDMVVFRHVLEHIDDPQSFVSNIKDIVGDNGEKTFYVEVPNILYTLRDLGIWDLIYEHCSYFSATSMSKLFEKLDFGVKNVSESYGGQFLSIEASTNASDERYETYVDVVAVQGLVEKFSTSFNQKVGDWKKKLSDFQSQDKTVVVWGGGSKGVSFLNFLQTSDSIKHIVDINPRKTGKFVAGTGQEYITPDALTKIKPDAVIIMNPVYKEEITKMLEEMGLSPEIFVA